MDLGSPCPRVDAVVFAVRAILPTVGKCSEKKTPD
jgi:hypothetical protein